MHGPVNQVEFLADIAAPLGCYYLALAVMNAVAATYQWKSGTVRRFLGVPGGTASVWMSVAVAFLLLAVLVFRGHAGVLSIPQAWRDSLNGITGPVMFCGTTLGVLLVMFWLRRFFVKPAVAWTLLNAAFLFMGLSLTDPHFAKIVTKPDNVAIVSMVFLLGFFTWLGAYRAVQNDDRLARGEETLEALDREKVLVWPDLVYIELICMVALMALLIVWAICLQAPLEEPASSVKTPNPSKAPWYFVGLQEMLYYYDPWMAGVVLPSLIIFGLMAIPYLDCNEKGNGYYTINDRKFAYVTFQFGFLGLWILLILMGTFFRGPNWTFFGIYEAWDVHKVDPQRNINLSQFFWIDWLGVALPRTPDDVAGAARLPYIVFREAPGVLALLLYFCGVPPLLALGSRFFHSLYQRMGAVRYLVVITLLLIMILLPVKMLARWTVDLQYFVAIPEYSVSF